MTIHPVYLIIPPSKLSIETRVRERFWNTHKKKIAIAGFGGIVFFSLVVSLMFGLQKGNSTLIRRDFEPLYNLTTSAIYETMDFYCTHVPLLFTDDCDKFINRFLKRMSSKPPQLTLPPESNFNEKKVYTALLFNMARLMGKYIFIFDQLMEQEHDILCDSFAVEGIDCVFPESCADQKNDSDSMFYCRLHLIRDYLTEVKSFSEKDIPDAVPSHPLIDDVPYFSQGAPSDFRRWYTMAILKSTINQVTIFRNELETTRK